VACDFRAAFTKMGTVTSSPRPDEPGPHAPRRPDSTDPDLAPVALTETGHLPSYVDEGPAGRHDVDGSPGEPPLDDPDALDPDALADRDHEAVEDGLQSSREPGAVAVAARLSRRPRDMAISIGVLLVAVFALFGLYRCLGGDEVATVDPGPTYAEARQAGAFPVAEPAGLGDEWRPVSAVYVPQTAGDVLRVGWRTPEDGTLQLIESNLSPDALLPKELGADAQATGAAQDVNGKQWQVYEARKGERAYVLQEPGRTVIVVGKAADAELRQFVASLK
jgi:hypothetical protein